MFQGQKVTLLLAYLLAQSVVSVHWQFAVFDDKDMSNITICMHARNHRMLLQATIQ
jgi:hypothetical protein